MNYARSAPASVLFTFPSGLGAGTVYRLTILNAAGTTLYTYDLDASKYTGSALKAQKLSLPLGAVFVRVYGGAATPAGGAPIP